MSRVTWYLTRYRAEHEQWRCGSTSAPSGLSLAPHLELGFAPRAKDWNPPARNVDPERYEYARIDRRAFLFWKPRRASNTNGTAFCGRHVLGGDVENPVGVDVECDLDLRNAALRWRQSVQIKLTQASIILGHHALVGPGVIARSGVEERKYLHWEDKKDELSTTD